MPEQLQIRGTTDPEVILEGQSLCVRYNRAALAIEDVSISVPKGSIVALLGSNGAGKTSTLRALTGFLASEAGALTGGKVILKGVVQNGKSPAQIARAGAFLVPERDKVFATLTVAENFAAVPARRNADRARMTELAFEVFPALPALQNRLAGLLSGGERQMLAIARALVAQPEVLLVDELSLGLAPNLVTTMIAALDRIRELTSMSILLVEQNALAALRVADYAYILQTGKVVLEGRASDLLGSKDVQHRYLGMGEAGGGREYRIRPVAAGGQR